MSKTKTAKIAAISRRLADLEASGGRELLLSVLDEAYLDLLIIALRVGEVTLHEAAP